MEEYFWVMTTQRQTSRGIATRTSIGVFDSDRLPKRDRMTAFNQIRTFVAKECNCDPDDLAVLYFALELNTLGS